MEFWLSVVPSVVGATVGGTIAALIARWTFASDRKVRASERISANEQAAKARARARVEDLLDVFAEMQSVVAETNDMNRARGLAQKLAMRVEVIAMDLTPAERQDLRDWGLHVHESFLASVEWQGDENGWRSRTDAFRAVLTISTEQILQWLRGEATTAELTLIGDEALARFLPPSQ